MRGKGGSIRVLHVDDEPGLSELVATHLERENDRFTVHTASRVTDGVAILGTHDVDCIVSDYDMPGQNGLEFLETVRQEYPELPFILYTGKGSEEVASDAISAGVTDYLQKERGTDQYTILANRIENAVERSRIEHEAEQTRSQLQAISEHSADAIVILDADSRIRFANPAVEAHFGYTPAELQGEKLTTIMPERYRADHLAGMKEYLETGERSLNWSNIEFTGLQSDGTEVPLSVSFGEFEHDGERRFIGILRDITERTRMEAELREREERFRQLAENIQEVVWMSDPAKEEMIYVNPAYEEIWGRTLDALYDDPNAFLDAIHPADHDRVEAAVATQESGEYDETYRIIRPDGDLRWVHDRAVPIEDDTGEIYRIVGIASDITAQKRQTQRLQTLVSNLPGIVYRCRNDPDWPMEFVKGECESLTGYRPEQIENGDISWGEDIIHPADQERMWEAVQDAIEDDRSFEVTYRIRTRNGTTRWVWERGRLVTPEAQDEKRLEGFITDITERKQYEERLQRRTEQYQTVLDNTEEAIFLLDVEDEETFRIAQVNQAEEELLGQPAAQVEGKTLYELYDTETAEKAVNAYRRCLERGEPIVDVQEYQLSGEPRVFETTIAPVVTDAGIRQLVGVSREITTQHKMEETVREERHRFEQVLDTSPIGIAILDTDGQIVRANERAEEVLGLTDSEITGRMYDDPDWEIVDEEGDPVPSDDLPFARVMATGEAVYDYEHGVVLPDGSQRWLSINAAPITENGDTTQVVTAITDITKKREYERTLERQNERLNEFASIVSHDLRNPLNVAGGRLELAQEDCDSEHLAEIEQAHDRMATLIENLLMLARDGETKAALTSIDLEDLTEECWRNVETEDATLVTDVDRLIRGDETRLHQLVENLVRNAVEHGGRGVTVTVGELADGFYIEDDGAGIPTDARERVFG